MLRWVILTICVLPYLAFGQPGANDPTFNPDDPGYLSHGTGTVFDVALQPDGKVIVAGWFVSYNGIERERLARLHEDGTLDLSFDAGPILSYGSRNALEIQPDGKVLSGGYNSYGVVRHSSEGTLDPSFTIGDLFNSLINAGGVTHVLKCQSDGKILVGGSFSYYNGSPREGLVRILSNGTFDPGFSVPYEFRIISAIEVLPDDRILIAGNFSTYGGVSRSCIARLNADGTLDPSFDPGEGANARVTSLVLLPDGDILVGGAFTEFNGSACNRIVRLNSDGSSDDSFNTENGPNGTVEDLAVDTAGKVLIVGDFTSCSGIPRSMVASLNSDGSVDASFDQLSGASDQLFSVSLQPDGKVLIGGAMNNFDGYVRNGITRLETDGSLDWEFNPVGGAVDEIVGVEVLSDNRILIAGEFTAYGDLPRNRIALIEENGSLDPSFDPGMGANSVVRDLSIQSDDKAVIVGIFTSYDNMPCGRVARINVNGSLDTTFQTGTGASDQVYCVSVRTDGRILLSGSFTSFNGVGRSRSVLLTPDGAVDPSFDPVEISSAIRWHFWQPDGKVVVMGYFTTVGGTPRNRIARLNSDGTLDPGFDPGVGPDGIVMKGVVQPDGKILIGGYFQNVNGMSRNGIARLNADGSLDVSFDPGEGIGGQGSGSNTVHSIIHQPDGKILVGGNFQTYDGFPSSCLARLNPDGDRDTLFTPGNGADNMVQDMELLASGDYLIAGHFIRYDEARRSRLARVLGGNDHFAGLIFGHDELSFSPLQAYPNPAPLGGVVTVTLDDQLAGRGPLRIVLIDALGREVGEELFVPYGSRSTVDMPRTAGVYYLGLWASGNYLGGGKIIVE